jgi:hypothetical protein
LLQSHNIDPAVTKDLLKANNTSAVVQLAMIATSHNDLYPKPLAIWTPPLASVNQFAAFDIEDNDGSEGGVELPVGDQGVQYEYT